jgi:hypothetical protein
VFGISEGVGMRYSVRMSLGSAGKARMVGVVVATTISFCACGTSSVHDGGTSSPASSVTPLSSLVASVPAGFKSESTDLDSGGRTGAIGIAEASSADCDGIGEGALQRDQMVG